MFFCSSYFLIQKYRLIFDNILEEDSSAVPNRIAWPQSKSADPNPVEMLWEDL